MDRINRSLANESGLTVGNIIRATIDIIAINSPMVVRHGAFEETVLIMPAKPVVIKLPKIHC